MIFAAGDDTLVTVYDDEAAACRDWEGLDVESGAVTFYAADGTWLRPEFTTPNSRGLAGFGVSSGTYHLVRCEDRPPDIDSIEVALSEASGVNPNRHFDSLDAIRRHLDGVRGPAEKEKRPGERIS
jgi:hypothetical protein